jgi:ferritin-like metal-binding protein YciE
MALKSLADAFHDELRDVLSAEKQLLKALPKMSKAATNPRLIRAFEKHLKETTAQVDRVEKAFGETGKAAKAKKCEAMEGLIAEGASVMEEDASPEVMDALLIACAQKVEHYEIATYGTLCTWAKVLGYSQALKLLKANIAEEEATDQALTDLAQTINADATDPAE